MAIVGIDLGTTNSLVAVMRGGAPETLANELGDHLTPSAVAVAADGGILVGRAAKDRLVVEPRAGRAFFKRDMGTEARHDFGGRKWTPTECSALILQELKRVAELRLGAKVDRAVISVPAYFRESQRQATSEAARIAGLGVARILNEPTAAALAFGYRAPDQEKRLLVFDIGGGTLDVTVLNIFEGVIEVVASGGESHLGGEDYTDALLDRVLAECGLARTNPGVGRIRQQVEVLKRNLSARQKAGLVIGAHELVVSRGELEAAGESITARIRPVLVRCLRDANLEAAALDDVLLVGGASRMPLIRELVKRELGREGNQLLDPDRVVALGAAVQAALCEADAHVADVVLTDVCAHTLGINVSKELAPGHHQHGYFEPLIDRNTTVPTSRAKPFQTLHPNQDELIIEVYQGEGRMVADNQLLGKLKVNGLRHKSGQSFPGAVEVRFSYDMNGLLEVEATVLHSGRRFQTVIEERPGALTPKQIEAAIQRLAPLKTHPRDRVLNRARLERAGRLYADLSGPARDELAGLLDVFESALESGDEARWEEVGRTLDELLARYYREEGERQSPEPQEPQ
jgi:molecular chaperone HscC